MARPDTFWLTLTNIVLGTLVVLCFLIIALGTLCETLSKLKKRRSYEAELNHDMQEMFAATRSPVAALRAEVPSFVRKLLEAVCRIWRQLSHRH
jgi:hypothetical protein